MAKYVLVMLTIVISSCASQPKYEYPNLLIIGPHEDRVRKAASGIPLVYTKMITTTELCPSHMTVGGITVICEDDVNHTMLWLQEVLLHEDCHHKQLYWRVELNEQECQREASKTLNINRNMLIGTGGVLLLLELTGHLPF